jgi:hypothetical protein
MQGKSVDDGGFPENFLKKVFRLSKTFMEKGTKRT